MNIIFAARSLPDKGAVVVGVCQDRVLTPSATELDTATSGVIGRAIAVSRFTGRKGELLEIVAPQGVGNSRILLLGLGAPEKLGSVDIQDLGGSAYARLACSGDQLISFLVDELEGTTLDAAGRAAHYAFGAQLRSYRFVKYRTKEKSKDKPSVTKLSVLVNDFKVARAEMKSLSNVANGVFMTRDLVSEPANVIYPESFVERVSGLAKLGIRIEVLCEDQMEKLGMGALLGVGQGSKRDSRLLVLRWDGAAKVKGVHKYPVAFVGKGVTFDTGGISIKPGKGMEEEKCDMGGAGVVAGLMAALAGRNARVNAVGVCGLVENMPAGNAQRPGDIVTSMSGQTIEVINTDTEGRLVLADALWYTIKRFRPRAIVDIATLTGAIEIALGMENAGLFSNNDELSEAITTAGQTTGEKVWRLPLDSAYDKLINSEAADMKNTGDDIRGGAITAAQLLQRFVKEGTPWAHLDIAGVTWSIKDKPTVPKGATAFGVRLLDALVAAEYEIKGRDG